MAEVKLQDYIVTVSKEPEPSEAYSVILENNTDFIISRKTAKSSKELVILISQGLFYEKDTKSGKIESVTESRLRSFFRGLDYDSIALKEVNWINYLTKDSYNWINKVISNKSLTDMCRHNLLKNIRDPGRVY